MKVVKILMRLTSAAIAGLFAARGGAWLMVALLYLLVTLVPIRPRGSRFAFWSCVAFTLIMGAVAAFLGTRGEPLVLWVLLAVYGALQTVQERLAAQAQSSARGAGEPTR